MLLATLPVTVPGVVLVIVLIGIARARASGRSPRLWGVVALVALGAFVAYLLIATAVLRASSS